MEVLKIDITNYPFRISPNQTHRALELLSNNDICKFHHKGPIIRQDMPIRKQTIFSVREFLKLWAFLNYYGLRQKFPARRACTTLHNSYEETETCFHKTTTTINLL